MKTVPLVSAETDENRTVSTKEKWTSHHNFKLTKSKSTHFAFDQTLKTVMIYPLFSSAGANKQSVDKLSLVASSLSIDNKENSIKISRHRRNPSKQSNDFSTVMSTNMGGNIFDLNAALRLEEEKGKPILKKAHRRTQATDWSELRGISQHRRSSALSKEDFMEILDMVGDDLLSSCLWDLGKTPFMMRHYF